MEPWLITLIAALIVAVASVVQAVIGFGVGVLAVPLLALLDPSLVPAPLAFASLFMTFTLAWQNRHGFRGHAFGWVLVGSALGAPLGAIILTWMRADFFNLLVVVVIGTGILLSLVNIRVAINPRSQMLAGFSSALMGTASGIGGPPLALLYQYEEGARIRGVLSAIFFITTILALIWLAIYGHFGMAEAVAGIQLVPGMILGYVLGPRIATHLNTQRLRTAIIGMSSLSVLVLAIRQFT